MISVVVLTLNEAINIERCLESVAFSNDVLVLDSGSTDETCPMAEALGARVMHRRFDSFGRQRNFAMDSGHLRNEWVLHLDADEVVTPALRAELQAITREDDALPAWRIPSKLMFMGRWLRHAGMYPSYQVRFGRRSELRFVDHGHGQREALSADFIGTVRAPMEHFNFSKGVNDWLTRHLRYAAAEAIQAISERREHLKPSELLTFDRTSRRRALKRIANRLPLRPTLRFAYSYILRGGFLDGVAGFRYSLMLAIYQQFIDLNIAELRAGRESVAGDGRR